MRLEIQASVLWLAFFLLIYNYMFLCNDDLEARLDLPTMQSNTVEHTPATNG